MGAIEKIDAEIDKRYNKSDDFFKLVVNTNIITGLQLAKEIILSEQKKALKLQQTEAVQWLKKHHNRCLGCDYEKEEVETVPCCICRRLQDDEYHPKKPLTKGDVIRESNESLAEWYAMKTDIYAIGEPITVNPLNKEKFLNYINQPQEDTNE